MAPGSFSLLVSPAVRLSKLTSDLMRVMSLGFSSLVLSDAVLLNNIVQNFGMLDLVKKVLASHKSQMDRHREQYTRSLAGQWWAWLSLRTTGGVGSHLWADAALCLPLQLWSSSATSTGNGPRSSRTSRSTSTTS